MKKMADFVRTSRSRKARHLVVLVVMLLICIGLQGCGGKDSGKGGADMPRPVATLTGNQVQ
jgi:hypothetical protein